MSNWEKVYESNDRVITELIKNEMINQGINAVILNKVDTNYPMIGLSQIKVPEEQVEKAKKIIELHSSNDKEA